MTDQNPFESIELATVRRIHILGICGTGMGTFAGMLKARGFEVTGSDENVYPPMSDMLAAWGIPILKGYRPENLDEARPDLVIVGNVIRRANPEATAMRERGLPHMSFPAALGSFFLDGKTSCVVVGTHGKTTTTALLGHLLTTADRDPSFLVGGVALDSKASFRVGAGPHVAIEGDEYDTAYFDKGPKFLHYRPHAAIWTSLEFDHADIYADMDAYCAAFAKFVALMPPDGLLAVSASYPEAVRMASAAACRVETYGFEDGADWQARNVTHEAGAAHFDLFHLGEKQGRFTLLTGGSHNVENALGAIALARFQGLSFEEIARGLSTFHGVKRRQEIRSEASGVTLIDDFAHHPTAVRLTLNAIGERFPDRRVWAIFEPRSNTSRRNFHQRQYAEAFDGAARVILARPLPTDRVPQGEELDLDRLVRDIDERGIRTQAFKTADEIAAEILKDVKPGDVLLVMSNGAFGGLVETLKQGLDGR
ncbi:MAG: UDP-N-acetylmuramate--L-alanine ligase [Myxococcales bacterium]|jgi:UDP-N-acetylmuramate: L-alanyl-gamma-D-glutamyl-meso-diaminopimelate ligase|nr:UDP-N-acetylmuramate--L-alanine ligase [Myxococcales bacterium]